MPSYPESEGTNDPRPSPPGHDPPLKEPGRTDPEGYLPVGLETWETEFLRDSTSCLLGTFRRIRNRCPLLQEDAAEHQLDVSPDLTAP